MTIKFTLDDRYGLQDNCYYESVLPAPVKDKAVMGDAGETEFLGALSRKQNELITARGEPDIAPINEKNQYR